MFKIVSSSFVDDEMILPASENEFKTILNKYLTGHRPKIH